MWLLHTLEFTIPYYCHHSKVLDKKARIDLPYPDFVTTEHSSLPKGNAGQLQLTRQLIGCGEWNIKR